MTLKYAGLKPMIDQHGVHFKDGKDDKFSYLIYAIDILKAIDHPYQKKMKYSHNIINDNYKPQEIINILLSYHPNLEKTMNQEIVSYKTHLDSEEEHVNNLVNLTDIEKKTFINNLKIMRDYKIQRAKNKIFYFHCIETIVEIILSNKIKEIDTPFNERFWHILQTIQGVLSKHRISSNLKIENKDEIKAMLFINIY
ncbi:hypothetical protein CPU12_03770 [Malaciobacter molluscorum LMG 25693]|uniref:Uncharacterized protein n=1 Tax=Malaciobacter molluscorum LMG 25693 TaxID=870501 RepID=A0A2G1DJN7_9BACT|nr:hypothetical protein [Malaciobacter molluscorum]AXX92856.1 hypothetical protein AMOL_1893 [Malaciobacter molluscorum LMG 25693]PHO18692.1 hypothetical protein CPU12_03770 [Malaciobacter molluscorum LMG 25693]